MVHRFAIVVAQKISPPAPQPIVNYQNDGKVKYAGESSKISTEKITLPARKTQYADANIPYIKPKESRNISLNNEPVAKKFNFTLPTISNQKPSIAALCCGGIILLVVISAIFSSITHGSTPSTTNSNSLTSSASSAVSSTTAKSGEPGEALSTYLFAYQHVGSTFPVKISADSLYDYLSKNATSTMSKQEVGIVVSSVRSEWTIFDYKIGETKKQGKYATVTVDIIWQSKTGIQIIVLTKYPWFLRIINGNWTNFFTACKLIKNLSTMATIDQNLIRLLPDKIITFPDREKLQETINNQWNH